MYAVVKNSWALFLGMFLLMLGNGVQATLLGIRGAIEGFDAGTMSLVMSGYFVGFLGGSRLAPQLIQRVGHVRVFAALGSLISACFILYAAAVHPISWFAMRVITGFCFSGVYVVAESWLNDAATNENRGKTMSVYLIVQMIGIVSAQAVVNLADPSGYLLFVIISVVVSLAFAPILLSANPSPTFHTTKPMSLRRLFQVSPLGCVGIFLLGGIFAGIFGMAAVFGTEKGLSISDISLFISAIYIGGMVMQYPIGLVSDVIDRRILITGITGFGAVAMFIGVSATGSFPALLVLAFLVGGAANPLYSLLIAYTNDALEHDDMAAASGGLIFINGLGATAGPFLLGWMMNNFGPDSFFIYLGCLLAMVSLYGTYRMTQRSAPGVDAQTAYAALSMTASQVAVEMSQEIDLESDDEQTDA